MKIYTKTGDKGETSLLGGTRVSKAHQKIEAYGTVDELNSAIGLLISFDDHYKGFLLGIQHDLFNIGSLLATERDVNFELPEIVEGDVIKLENEIDALNLKLEPLKNFILPGGTKAASQAHVARCICRRAERRTVVLERDYDLIVRYLNRLSDYLFVLSRALLKKAGVSEISWKK
ncbi:MAG: cob(I)yrinic acid a,c-diamide adenosyltransferase [Bacteroidia bacterium]